MTALNPPAGDGAVPSLDFFMAQARGKRQLTWLVAYHILYSCWGGRIPFDRGLVVNSFRRLMRGFSGASLVSKRTVDRALLMLESYSMIKCIEKPLGPYHGALFVTLPVSAWGQVDTLKQERRKRFPGRGPRTRSRCGRPRTNRPAVVASGTRQLSL